MSLVKNNHKAPAVLFLLDNFGSEGGMELSANRHIALLSQRLRFVPVCCRMADDPRQWIGKTEATVFADGPAYTVTASNMLGRDKGDIRLRILVEHISKIIHNESCVAVHCYGCFGYMPRVAAFSAAKCGIPLMLSFRGSDLAAR